MLKSGAGRLAPAAHSLQLGYRQAVSRVVRGCLLPRPSWTSLIKVAKLCTPLVWPQQTTHSGGVVELPELDEAVVRGRCQQPALTRAPRHAVDVLGVRVRQRREDGVRGCIWGRRRCILAQAAGSGEGAGRSRGRYGGEKLGVRVECERPSQHRSACRRRGGEEGEEEGGGDCQPL